MEPSGFDPFVVEDVYMVKNINTELTYFLLLQIIAGNASDGPDYLTFIEHGGSVRVFPSNQRRLQVFDHRFVFEIRPDGFPESIETVEISSDPLSNPGPAYTRPHTGAVTTIFILDDDSKKNSYITVFL